MSAPWPGTSVVAGPILIVDDDEAVRLALAAFLRCAGYEPLAVENGAAALALLGEVPVLPSAIILDLMMPEMDGAAFRERQLADPRLASIPVIIVSVLAGTADTSRLGAVACLPKAFDPDDLLVAIERHALRRDPPAIRAHAMDASATRASDPLPGQSSARV